MSVKKIKIIKSIIIVMMAGIIGYIAYPFVTNIPAYFRRDAALSEWEDLKQSIEVTEIEVKENAAGKDLKATEPPADFEIDRPVLDSSIGTAVEANRDISIDQELLFPLKITIPKIDLEEIVYESADVETLKKGPGHIPQTPLYGEYGRFTISGHRTTYGAPFNKIDRLEPGDLINIETLDGQRYVYAVSETVFVKPTAVEILEGTSDRKELLLTSCHPEYSARERIIVISQLIKVYPFEIEKPL